MQPTVETTAERPGHPPRRIMWVSPDRIAYWGGLGCPTTRNLGSWTFYLGCTRPFQVAEGDGPFKMQWFALVAPWTPHRVFSEDRDLAQVLVEPENVDGPAMIEQLVSSPERRAHTAGAIREGFNRAPGSPEDFDLQYFGRRLPSRAMDPRIRDACKLLSRSDGSQLSSVACAAHAHLSLSRFMHLFSVEAGTTFRRFRAWKRARRLLALMGGQPRLVEVALEAGYSDSTHFSRSVRRCWGYSPSAMFDGSRHVSVISHLGVSP